MSGLLHKDVLPHANFTQVSVTPAQQPEEVAGVFITKAECKGYFQELLLKTNPEGCNKQGLGPGAGTLTVGGTTSLKGTVFGISFV